MESNQSYTLSGDFYHIARESNMNRVQIAVYLFISQIVGNLLLIVLLQSFRNDPMSTLNERLFKIVCQVS